MMVYNDLYNIIKRNNALEFSLYLKENNVDVNTPILGGRTILYLCINLKNPDLGILMLDMGADPNGWNTADGITPLHLAVRQASMLPLVEELLKKGADVNAKNHHGRTPMYEALSMGDSNIVKLLLDYGASVHTMDNKNITPLEHCVTRSGTEKLKLLLEHLKPQISLSTYKKVVKRLIATDRHRSHSYDYLMEEHLSPANK